MNKYERRIIAAESVQKALHVMNALVGDEPDLKPENEIVLDHLLTYARTYACACEEYVKDLGYQF